MVCLPCARGFHEECLEYPCCCDKPDRQEAIEVIAETRPAGRPLKDNDEVTVSAGRKRAAVAYEINPDAACEWSGRADCGGGKVPILGCIGNSQKHRHHGPVKNTTHNERTNIHLICARCHNTWHAKNDPIYEEATYADLPHNPRQMTRREVAEQLSIIKE